MLLAVRPSATQTKTAPVLAMPVGLSTGRKPIDPQLQLEQLKQLGILQQLDQLRCALVQQRPQKVQRPKVQAATVVMASKRQAHPTTAGVTKRSHSVTARRSASVDTAAIALSMLASVAASAASQCKPHAVQTARDAGAEETAPAAALAMLASAC